MYSGEHLHIDRRTTFIDEIIMMHLKSVWPDMDSTRSTQRVVEWMVQMRTKNHTENPNCTDEIIMNS